MERMLAQLRLMVNHNHNHEATVLEDEAVVEEEEVRTDEVQEEDGEATIMHLPQSPQRKILALLLRERT